MTAYYNEIDPYAAQWLRNLIAAGHIAPGDVDERSIEDVRPDDLRPYTQCHFFAGVGVWSRALRNIGWPDDAPIWSGSCPCQPFSTAGKSGGFDDERHLWPAFYHLIIQCQPRVLVGEQVASKDGLAWLDLVHSDMEAADYSFGAVDLCAAGVGAPHIRQRLYWVADNNGERRDREQIRLQPGRSRQAGFETGGRGGLGGVANGTGGRRGELRDAMGAGESGHIDGGSHAVSGMAQPESIGGRTGLCHIGSGGIGLTVDSHSGAIYGARPAGPTNGQWRDVDWLYCRDGKWRPVEPGTFPLAHGAPSRVGRLRAYGNAINLAQAETFLAASLVDLI